VLTHPGYRDLGKSDPPPAPDYAGAARETATGNADAARIAAKANRISQYTPYGSLVYSRPDPNDQDVWQSNLTLSPEQQKLLTKQNKISMGLSNTMDRGLGYVSNMLDSPLDTSKFTKVDPASVAGREAVTAALLDRLQPSLDRQRQMKENALLIQGHNRGGEAWNATEDDLARAENDARLAAVQAGGQEQSRLLGLQQAQRQNQLAETQTLRNEPINTLNAVRSGAQVTNPQFINVPQQATTQGANLLGAAQAQHGAAVDVYNADRQAQSNMMGGLFQLGSAALPYMFSDRRLKRNIKRIGTHATGIGIYEYDIFDRHEIGVMADEVLAVMPDAVIQHPSGFMMVNYARL